MQNTRKGWQQIQDDRLLKIIRKYGIKNWSLVAEKLSIGTTFQRTGKQCRQRWYNHLNPQIDNKAWSTKDDEVLFQAHRRFGCKWKQISQLFSGRTDNSVKNHFYSTVRRCLRKVNKQSGERNTITMKSIKPNVLSTIVENTELTDLIVKLGRGKNKNEDTTSLRIDQNTVQRIRRQLRLINLKQDGKEGEELELSKKQKQIKNNRQNTEYYAQVDDIPSGETSGKEDLKTIRPNQQTISSTSEDTFKLRQQQQDFGAQTLNQSKDKEDCRPKSYRMMFPLCSKQQLDKFVKEDSNYQREDGIEWGGLEQVDSNNFFLSPSCSHLFPDMRLLAKLSKVSLSLSPTHSHAQDRNRSLSSLTNPYLSQKLESRFENNAYLDESNPSYQFEDREGH